MIDLEKHVEGKTYIRSDTIADIFGWSSRQMVYQIAKREGWQSVRGYHRYYLKEDVKRYAESRQHQSRCRNRPADMSRFDDSKEVVTNV